VGLGGLIDNSRMTPVPPYYCRANEIVHRTEAQGGLFLPAWRVDSGESRRMRFCGLDWLPKAFEQINRIIAGQWRELPDLITVQLALPTACWRKSQ
jgi:hypothetical protein